MLQSGKVYEYEYMVQNPQSRIKDVVHFEVLSFADGVYDIRFVESGLNSQIHVGSPMAEFAEEIENVA